MKKVPITLFLFFIIACTEDPAYKNSDFDLKYNLSEPVEVYSLPGKLEEISGIHLIDNGLMACIQDEDGIIFIYDLNSEEIIKEIDFGPKGDYEDIEIIGNDAFVLRSDGTIFNIKNFLSSDFNVVQIKTPFNKGNNTEGLTYNASKNTLLIALKDDPGTKPKEDKAVYAYNLDNNELKQEPVLIIKNSEIKDLISKGTAWNVTIDFKSFIDGDKAIFRPSAIAIHPLTKDYYILSSVNKLLCILDENGKLKYVYPINIKYFNQPEGIYFTNEGEMYISNEASSGKANILKFNYNE